MFRTSLALSIALAIGILTGSNANAAAVKIGFLGTLSGPGAALGQDQFDAFMLGLEHNKQKLGSIEVDVVRQDDQLKPDVATQLARELIERDKVQIVTGLTFSNVALAVAKPLTDAGVFVVGSNAGPALLAGKDCNPLLFMTSWTTDSNGQSMGAFAANAGYKRMLLLAPNYQAGKEATEGFKRLYKGTIIDTMFTPLNQLDYSTEIAQIQAAAPDAIYIFYPGALGVNFVKQYQQAGLLGRIPLLSTSTIDGSTLPALKEIAVGAITGASYSPDLDNPTNKQFVADFMARYKRVPSLYAAQSYDAAQLIASALFKVKGDVTNRDAFRRALEAADFNSDAGPFKFNVNHYPIRNFYRVDVEKDASGNAVFVSKGPILSEHKDAYFQDCRMP